MSHYGGSLKVHPEWAGITEEGKQVFSCWVSTFGVPTDMANARRLVQCWNEHDDLEKERDELVKALRRQFSADKTLIEMPDDCAQVRYEQALEEHIASNKAIELILAKYPEAS